MHINLLFVVGEHLLNLQHFHQLVSEDPRYWSWRVTHGAARQPFDEVLELRHGHHRQASRIQSLHPDALQLGLAQCKQFEQAFEAEELVPIDSNIFTCCVDAKCLDHPLEHIFEFIS